MARVANCECSLSVSLFCVHVRSTDFVDVRRIGRALFLQVAFATHDEVVCNIIADEGPGYPAFEPLRQCEIAGAREPPWDCWRPFSSNDAAMGVSSSMA